MCDGDLTISDLFGYPFSVFASILALLIIGIITGKLEMWLSIKVGHALDLSCRTFIGCIFWVATCTAVVALTYLIVFVGTKIFC